MLIRTFSGSPDDVWASLTEPERTARWFGPWRGDAGPGRSIQVQMAFEEGAPWLDARIDACEPPRRLAMTTSETGGGWILDVTLSAVPSGTELRFVQHRAPLDEVGEVGPGWEYYLDLFSASRAGEELPAFDDYYPALRQPYLDLREGLTTQS